MPMREYYTVDRSPREIKDLWDWATKECRGKIEHESPYAMGVLATLEYLMGTREDPPAGLQRCVLPAECPTAL